MYSVLASWIRVPCYLDDFHLRSAIHCDHCEEGYVAFGGSKEPRLTWIITTSKTP